MCVEFDGIQHFKPSSFGSDRSEEAKQKNLENTQHRDRIKTDYCKEKGIRLLRIPYTEKHRISEILIESGIVASARPTIPKIIGDDLYAGIF
jgi:hypothetical protein